MKYMPSFLLFLPACSILHGSSATQADMDAPQPIVQSPQADERSQSREIDGETVEIRLRCPTGSEDACDEAANMALNEVQRLIDVSSVWSTTGDVARINESAGQEAVEISADVQRMLTSAFIVSTASGGAFDVTIGALSGLWGIDGASLPSDQIISERLHLVDWTMVELGQSSARLKQEGMSIVLDGLVKGDAADSALNLIPMDWDALVDVGGDLAARGEWEVQIPIDAVHGGGSVTFWVQDTVLVASGTRGTGELDGAIDPRSGKPSPGGRWAVATHKQGAIADALATTLLVTGAETAVIDQLGAWALLMTADGWVEVGGRTASVSSWSVASTGE